MPALPYLEAFGTPFCEYYFDSDRQENGLSALGALLGHREFGALLGAA